MIDELGPSVAVSEVVEAKISLYNKLYLLHAKIRARLSTLIHYKDQETHLGRKIRSQLIYPLMGCQRKTEQALEKLNREKRPLTTGWSQLTGKRIDILEKEFDDLCRRASRRMHGE